MFIIIPKGRYAFPYIMIVIGCIILYLFASELNSHLNVYGVFNVFDNSKDDYELCDSHYLLIDELTVIEYSEPLDNDKGCRCIAKFVDGVGNNHYVTLTIYNDDEKYDEVIEGSHHKALMSIKFSGLFKEDRIISTKQLRKESVNRAVERVDDADHYMTYILKDNNSYILKTCFYMFLCLLDIVVGVLICIKIFKDTHRKK